MQKTIFMSSKFQGDKNEIHINTLEELLRELGYIPYTPIKELDDFGRKSAITSENAYEVMEEVKNKIKECEYMLIDFQEKGVGIGIEAGVAWALGKSIILTYPDSMEPSLTMMGIAKKIIPYENYDQLKEKLEIALKELENSKLSY